MKFSYVTNRQRQHEGSKLIASWCDKCASMQKEETKDIFIPQDYRRYKEMIHILGIAMMCKRSNKLDYICCNIQSSSYSPTAWDRLSLWVPVTGCPYLELPGIFHVRLYALANDKEQGIDVGPCSYKTVCTCSIPNFLALLHINFVQCDQTRLALITQKLLSSSSFQPALMLH